MSTTSSLEVRHNIQIIAIRIRKGLAMKKQMHLWDIIFINVAAIVGLRWLPIAAGFGAAAIMFWVIGTIIFFIPLGLMSSELATAWPDEGGLYVWVKTAYGEKPAFIVSWFYWINGFFYGPSLFTFLAVTATFVINPSLAQNKYLICSAVLVGIWSITLLNLRGLGALKMLSKISGLFGIILPGIIIILLGFGSAIFLNKPIPTSYALPNLIPHLGSIKNIAMLSALMFSMAGIELTPTLAGNTFEPQKTFPRAILISAVIIVLTYIIGTVAITLIISPDKIGAASGIMDALDLIAHEIHLPILVPFMAVMIVLGNLGGASAWLVAPIKMLFESCKGGILPPFLVKLNKHDMPGNAMLVQTSVVTCIVVFIALLPSVNVFYETLLIIAAITYFIPYIYMFASFVKLRRTHAHHPRPYRVPGGMIVAWLCAALGTLSVLGSMILAFIMPPADISDPLHILIYHLELAIGVGVFAAIAYWIYWRYERRCRLLKNNEV